MNKLRFHGIVSLILVGLVSVLCLVVIAYHSWVWGAIYLVVIAAAPLAVLRSFCAKCPCKAHCAHVLPGKAAMAFARDPGPYTRGEIFAMAGSLLLLFGLPQFWLWKTPVLGIIYWVLAGIAFFQIRLAVCPRCAHTHCPLSTQKVSKETKEIL